MHSANSVTLLGLRTGDVGPVRRATVDLGSALTVLYGLNGSGKSSTLGALIGSAAGRIDLPPAGVDVGVTHLLVRVPTDSSFLAPLIGDRTPRQITTQRLRAQVLSQWPACPDPAISTELATDVVVALFPVGAGSPAWEVWLCNTAAQPKAKAFREQCVSAWHANRDLVDVLNAATGDSDRAQALRSRLAEHLKLPPEEIDTELLLTASLGDADPIHRSYLHAFAGTANLDYAAAAARFWTFGEHDDLPVPLIRLGRTDRLDLPMIEEASTDVEALTLGWLSQQAARQRAGMGLEPRWVEGADDDLEDEFDSLHLAPWAPAERSFWFGGELDTLVGRVNEMYSDLLVGAPVLDVAVGEYLDWMTGAPFRWEADGHPLQRLSRAQQRWARVAITLGLSQEHGLLVVDEPEAALHRSAEAHMARGLAQLAAQGHTVVVATHTPALLNDSQARLLECRKLDGHSSIAPLGVLQLQRLDDLGLRPSDLLEGLRVFVLVEGRHDEQILNYLLAAQLRDASARVLPVHGARNLSSAIAGPFLLEWTQAAVLAVVDNQEARQIEQLKSDCVNLAASEGLDAAQLRIDQFNNSREATAEVKFVANFIMAGLQRGVTDRLDAHGLSKPDITWYFPPIAFMQTDKSWDQLMQEHVKAGGKRGGFKSFLRNKYGASFEPGTIQEALNDLPETPTDIVALGQIIQRLSDRQ